MAEDIRKSYILTTAANFFAKDPDNFLKYSDNKHLTKFLDDLNILILIVNVASKEVTITTKLENISSYNGKSLIFYKAKEEAITPENMKTNILISSIVDSPVDTLFYLIHNVYSPAIQYQQQSTSKGSDALDTKLTNNLIDLETNLKTAIRKSESSESNRRSALTPLDEFQYWADMAERGKTKDAKERAEFFYNEFKVLIDHYKKINSCPIQEICETIEVTQDSYDYIWQQIDYEPKYSQDRMINLLEITGTLFFFINLIFNL
jgi:dynein heavy chain 2